jgi:hypothetical protein
MEVFYGMGPGSQPFAHSLDKAVTRRAVRAQADSARAATPGVNYQERGDVFTVSNDSFKAEYTVQSAPLLGAEQKAVSDGKKA